MKIKDYIKIANYLDEIGRTVEADNVMKHVTSQFQSPGAFLTGPKFQNKNPFALDNAGLLGGAAGLSAMGGQTVDDIQGGLYSGSGNDDITSCKLFTPSEVARLLQMPGGVMAVQNNNVACAEKMLQDQGRGQSANDVKLQVATIIRSFSANGVLPDANFRTKAFDEKYKRPVIFNLSKLLVTQTVSVLKEAVNTVFTLVSVGVAQGSLINAVNEAFRSNLQPMSVSADPNVQEKYNMILLDPVLKKYTIGFKPVKIIKPKI
jgi:hypothetical protein